MHNATHTPGDASDTGTIVMLIICLIYVGCIACIQSFYREEFEKSLESEKKYSQWLQRQLRTHIDTHPTQYPPDPNVHHIAMPFGPKEDV